MTDDQIDQFRSWLESEAFKPLGLYYDDDYEWYAPKEWLAGPAWTALIRTMSTPMQMAEFIVVELMGEYTRDVAIVDIIGILSGRDGADFRAEYMRTFIDYEYGSLLYGWAKGMQL